MGKYSSDTIFALIDCNNFYASCERVFNPKLWGKPVIVLSNNDGCIVARSNEAKALGIKMAVPYFEMKDVIEKNNVYVFSSNYTLYGDMSRRVMNILSTFSPDIEFYSIDEAFLVLNGIFENNITGYCKNVRSTVMKWTGIPVSIGIAKTKTLAKIANEYAKKHPIYGGVVDLSNVDKEKKDGFLKKMVVEDIWGVGKQYARLLNFNRIYNAYEFTYMSEEWVKKNMSVVGLRTQLELRGTACIELSDSPQPQKNILASRSFGRPVECFKEMHEAVSQYVTRAAARLRKQNLAAGNISVFLATNRFKPEEKQYSNSISYSLPEPTDYTPDLIDYAIALLKKIYKDGYKYKKGGVLLNDLVPNDIIQQNMFDGGLNIKKKALMKTVDSINMEWGKDTLKNASVGIRQKWDMRRQFCSPRYTTSWNELLTARI